MTKRCRPYGAPQATLAYLTLLGIVALTGVARAQDAPVEPPPAPVAQPADATPPADAAAKPKGSTIQEKVTADKRLKRLMTALEAAGLTETLKGEGPFTIFAPTDAAFSKIPQLEWDALLKPENKNALATILKYHIVAGKWTAADLARLKEGDALTTLQGGKIIVHINGARVKVGDADLVKSDILASNGVIHQISAVMSVPPAQPDVETPLPAEPAPTEPAPADAPPPANP